MSTTKIVSVALIGLSLFFGSRPSMATDFEYPELMTTPRASERLEIESRLEQDRRWTVHIPIQVSALATLTAGIIQTSYKDPSKDAGGYSPWAGIAVGGGWLATTALLSALYSPYSSSLQDINAMPRKTQREQLTRERLAEEALEKPASLARKLTWLSVLTNFGASAYMISKAERSSLGTLANGISMAVAFTPVLFRYPWVATANNHQEYKKKIYAPVSTGVILPEPGTGKPVPGVALSFAF